MYLHVDTIKYKPNNDLCPVPSTEEIAQQIKRFETNKSPWKDKIPRKILKHADSSMIEGIYY